MMDKYGINYYSVYSTVKALMAERVIRIIKIDIYKIFSLGGNNRKHSVKRMKLSDVAKNHEQLLSSYGDIKSAGSSKFKVEDTDRISMLKSKFDKGYKLSWITELFKIFKVQITNPVTYVLKNMRGQPIKEVLKNTNCKK